MRTHLATWDPYPEGAWLFGSFARGEGDTSSDIDVLVLRRSGVDLSDPGWVVQLGSLSGDVRSWSGNPCVVTEYTTDEFEALAAAGERLPLDVARDGIPLAGEGRRRLLGIGS
jgi:hypothetical protein